MFKVLLGNALFAMCIGCWFVYADGERGLMLSGILLAFSCFLSGIFMGYLMRGPRKIRRAATADEALAADRLHAEPADAAVSHGENEEAHMTEEHLAEPVAREEEIEIPPVVVGSTESAEKEALPPLDPTGKEKPDPHIVATTTPVTPTP